MPQVAGAPDTRANSPRAYWPGAAYVDWVGTDFYSRFPNFAGLERFYRSRGALAAELRSPRFEQFAPELRR